jgi:hypothetical protein
MSDDTAAIDGAKAYFNDGRCSGHQQYNGRYCRDVVGPDQWCINCAGLMLLRALKAHLEAPAVAPPEIVDELIECADAIQTWREDDDAGTGDAIPLICDAEELLRKAADLLASSGPSSPRSPEVMPPVVHPALKELEQRLKQIRADVQPGRRGASTDDARFLLQIIDVLAGSRVAPPGETKNEKDDLTR